MTTLSTSQFLGNIDADLLQYTDLLLQKGYSNTKMLAHLTFQDIPEVPIGHKRLLINEVTKIRSPHSKSLLTSLNTQTMQCDSATLSLTSQWQNKTNLEPKELFPDSPQCVSNDDYLETYKYASPMEKHLDHVREDIEKKELEIESLKQKLEDRAKLLDDDDFDTRPSCGKCHQPGHRKNKCAGTKCPASVSCGKL